MDHTGPSLTQGDGSVRLQIDTGASDNWGSTNFFEPHIEATDPMEEPRESSSIAGSLPREGRRTRTPTAPEKKLTLFALRLAILEKIATGSGTLGFIWATVVVLGLSVTLHKSDFWFVTIILLIEAARIFSRSHQLEWQHQATLSITDAGINSFRALNSRLNSLIRTVSSICSPKNMQERALSHRDHAKKESIRRFRKAQTRTWTTSDVPLLPCAKWVFLSRNISKLLYWLQLLSASACVTLSLIKLIKQDFGEVSKDDSDKRNRKAALNIFYSLAFSEAMLFLMEKVYWEWNVIFYKLLEEVNNECQFGASGMILINRFFYDAYSKFVNGSIFDGLKMDLVSFGMELLDSDSSDEQLSGSKILQKFAYNDLYCEYTLRKIETSISTMERLVEMLNWKDPEQEEIRRAAAEILVKLTGKNQNSLRVARIPGAMESILSLLYTCRNYSNSADEIYRKNIVCDRENYEFSVFNQLGLLILKKLARDHDNCGKIGNTRGLLPKIIDFTHAEARLLTNDHVLTSQIMTVKRSLQVVKMLAGTTGATGKLLRQDISEIVFTISNIREILKHGKKYPAMQKLGIEILTSLGLEDEATERIGSTGGVLKELFRIFLTETDSRVRVVAGEALAMLVFESEKNCKGVLNLGLLDKLVHALDDVVLRVNSARILRNLCAYSGLDCFRQLGGVISGAPIVLRAIMVEQEKLQEVMIGLASQVFKFMTSKESSIMFEQAGIQESELAAKLVGIMTHYKDPPIKVPRIRRFSIELAIWMMEDKKENIRILKSLGMEKELEDVIETTSEVESFNVFSGTIGLNRHSTSIHLLVEIALALLADG